MAVDPQSMRDTLRFWASGVSVVTTTDGAQQAGMTVSAFNSLCLEPPLIVVCLFKDTTTVNMLRESGVFAVSILHADQADVSDRFAGRIDLQDGEDRFDTVSTTTAVTGAPIIKDAIAWLDCRVYNIHDGVSHWIVIGEAQAVGYRENDAAPLLYFDRNYREMQREKQPS